MKTLRRMNLVQFYLFESKQLDMAGITAFLGLNGSGKSSILDGMQAVMLGAHGRHMKFNAQSSSNTSTRTLKGYCLGVLRSKSQDGNEVESMARRDSMSYVSLGFADDKTGEPFTAGICLSASVDQAKHTIHGLFVLPGLMLEAEDFLEQSAEGKRPLAFGDFASRVSRRCRDISRTAMIKDKPEAYVGELLAQMGPPTARIDQREYMRAFAKSMQLRDVESVDEYVRQHIVPLDKIDVTDFGVQIKQFEAFKALIEQTKKQISELKAVQDYYIQVRRYLQREMSLYSLAANYDYEMAVQQGMELEDRLAAAQARAESLQRDSGANSRRREQLEVELVDVNAEISDDPELASHEKTSRDLKDAEQTLGNAEAEFARQILPLIDGLTHLETRGNLAQDQLILLREVKASLHKSRDNLAEVNAESLMQAVVDAGGLLRTCIRQLNMAAREATEARTHAAQQLKDHEGVLRALQQGELPLGQAATRASILLSDAGIEASPISYLIKVSDPEWQPAIEAYLAGQLEDFVVAEGQENEAVSLIRNLPREKAIYNIKVAQPRHLERYRHQRPAADDVASLISASNWVAEAFVRRALANVKFATSEADLARFERALSKDGMVSSGGGTSRKQLPAAGDLRIGRVPNVEQITKASAEHERLTRLFEAADAEDERLRTLVGRITVHSDEQAQQSIQHTLGQLGRSRSQRDALAGRLSSAQSETGQALLHRQQGLKHDISASHDRDKKLAGEISVCGVNIERYTNAIKQTDAEQARLQAQAVEAANSPYCDAMTVDHYKQQLDEQDGDDGARAVRARERAARSGKSRDESINKARLALHDYEQGGSVSLAEQKQDWEQGDAWVAGELHNLESSNLAENEEKADTALANAHEAFRRDIAYKLHEQMEQMKSRIGDLNNILDRSPPFSQNERYRFKVHKRESHSKLRKFIERVSTAGDDSQLAFDEPQSEPEIQDAMRELTAMVTESDIMDGKAPSVLTDYREFFSFDLAIRVNNEEVDTLSNRTGSGSGGEHRTPFYVIAGASLAAAYRLDERPGEGGGLMLLDEAFYSMDGQNSLAAARFLSKLGLQLIMAAPTSDSDKINTFTNTIFDIGREGLTPWLERITLKEAANRILTSDMPGEHPQLLDQAMAEQSEA